MKSVTRCLVALACLLPALSGAQGLLGRVSSDDEFLPPDEAFQFGAFADGPDAAALSWVIEDGYYLYRHRVTVKAGTPGVIAGAVRLPPGKHKTDEFFGDVEVYYHQLDATVPLDRPAGADAGVESEKDRPVGAPVERGVRVE